MAKVALISCVSKKLSRKEKAQALYVSPFFKYNLKYARKLGCDKIFILSAKYGLLSLDDEIEPYDQTLNSMKSAEKKAWAGKVLAQLAAVCDPQRDEFIFLAGENYRKHLLPGISNYKIPLQGKGIGKQLGFLKKQCGEI